MAARAWRSVIWDSTRSAVRPIVRQCRPNRQTAHRVIPATEPAPEAPRGRVSAVRSSRLNYQRRCGWDIEQTFRAAKHLLATRPIFHRLDETIRGHVFCSFLALVLKAELDARLGKLASKLPWPDILADLDALTETEVEQDGKRFLLRSAPRAAASAALRAAGVALPSTVQAASAS
jgi:hypothetical protein